jgi:hypothetical protein
LEAVINSKDSDQALTLLGTAINHISTADSIKSKVFQVIETLGKTWTDAELATVLDPIAKSGETHAKNVLIARLILSDGVAKRGKEDYSVLQAAVNTLYRKAKGLVADVLPEVEAFVAETRAEKPEAKVSYTQVANVIAKVVTKASPRAAMTDVAAFSQSVGAIFGQAHKAKASGIKATDPTHREKIQSTIEILKDLLA